MRPEIAPENLVPDPDYTPRVCGNIHAHPAHAPYWSVNPVDDVAYACPGKRFDDSHQAAIDNYLYYLRQVPELLRKAADDIDGSIERHRSGEFPAVIGPASVADLLRWLQNEIPLPALIRTSPWPG